MRKDAFSVCLQGGRCAVVVIIVIVVSPTPPQPPTPIMPKWTHTFAVESTSSDRVRAASVAYLAEQHSNSRNKKTRLTDVYSKKASKQEKYLSIVQASDINSILLTADEIRKEVIVFDGTTSHPPPHIPPPGCKYYYYYCYYCYYCIITIIHHRLTHNIHSCVL